MTTIAMSAETGPGGPPSTTPGPPDRPHRTGHPAGPPVWATEKDYQRTIIDAAKMFGWRVHHARPAYSNKGWRTPISGHAGFPDLVLAHPHVGVWFVELKYSTKLTADQARWGQVLSDAGADWRELRVPAQLHDFVQLLADAPRAAMS
jgi:hypothetical protein